MLRPNDVIAWTKARLENNQSELPQLVDGLLPGGQIVVGGAESQVQKALTTLGMRNRIGRITSFTQATLHGGQTTTFDSLAIVQLLTIAKSENFHGTVETTLAGVLKGVADGLTVEQACQVVLEQSQQIPRL